MPCYSPMIGWRKKNGEVVIYGDLRNEDWHTAPESLTSKGVNPYEDERIIVPCGQCTGCRLEYSRQWADRCYLESKLYETNYWLTLTYDDTHLESLLVPTVDKATGEITTTPSLYKKDLQDFLKRLRERWHRIYKHNGIRYYGCGEYGEKYHRPHYHITIFNIEIPDLKHWYSKGGFATFRSEEIEKLWGKGLVTINRNSWQTSAYTARYMLKKLKGKWAKIEYAEAGIAPEFCVCSRKPGIAREYYEKHKNEIYSYDGIAYAKISGNVATRKPPHYFDVLYKEEFPEDWERVKKARKEVAERSFKYQLVGTTLSRIQYNQVREDAKKRTIKALARKLEMGIAGV